VNEWKHKNNALVKEFVFKDFKNALKFVNKVAGAAEKMNHHPDILIHSYNKVKITLSTHSENKVTTKDIKLSRIIDKLFL
jgi:4a-hydroxytetrahydrobiopterin dehydratase